MSWYAITRQELSLSGTDSGKGSPVLFQHGLGGDDAQVAEFFPKLPNVRRLTLECRGQGRSQLGPVKDVSIAIFAADIAAFVEQQGVGRYVAGGVSMGAAIALRLAVVAPQNVRALILSRPAWLWDSAPANMQPFAEVAGLLARLGPDAALSKFDGSSTARRLARDAPDNLASLRGFFARPDPEATANLLAAIASDGPGVTLAQIRRLSVPTLVIGNGLDAIHPFAYAETLANEIPDARMVRVTPKSQDRVRHAEEVRSAIAGFLGSLDTDGDQS